jgi:hypothetical protein
MYLWNYHIKEKGKKKEKQKKVCLLYNTIFLHFPEENYDCCDISCLHTVWATISHHYLLCFFFTMIFLPIMCFFWDLHEEVRKERVKVEAQSAEKLLVIMGFLYCHSAFELQSRKHLFPSYLHEFIQILPCSGH